ncbi:MAG: DUF937 domain-containing protein [Spirulinaceae cyanobacterium RM2_2_10]|nr:DUF937 domain-containing protein [Spirulinaceae cyanobacterium SM2_1_0]NJO21480.1 DUF937 domain-containing protein [Spirulinaceae cyanobacterium RM2_2_10]
MSLFNTILSAIDNPSQAASPNQLSAILGTVQQLSQSNQANPETLQTAMGIIGRYTRSSLRDKRAADGEAAVANLVDRYSGTSASREVVNLLFNTSQVQAMTTEVAERTGIPATTLQNLLPSLVPLVLQFLQTGQETGGAASRNSVLSAFLDADGDGDVDIHDAMQQAGRYLQS